MRDTRPPRKWRKATHNDKWGPRHVKRRVLGCWYVFILKLLFLLFNLNFYSFVGTSYKSRGLGQAKPEPSHDWRLWPGLRFDKAKAAASRPSRAVHSPSCRIKHTSTETSIQLYIPSNSLSLERQFVVFLFRFCCYCNRRRQRSSVEHYNLNCWRHRACCHFLQNWCDILVKFSKLFNFYSELGLGLICKPWY